jgi:hypothetical protein
VPIIAAAGADEVVFVPTGRRVRRDAVPWCMIVSEWQLWQVMLAPIASGEQRRP